VQKVWSVSQLTGQIKDLLEPALARVFVRGEVANFRGANPRGHLYFSIKDANATLDVRVWQSTARGLKFAIKDGLSVIIEGGLNVYEPQGRYSLIVQKIEPEGVGAQALALEQLKQRLAAEGLIGDGRKKPRRVLPYLPRRIGVVTSVSGAALRDFLKVLHRRHPRLSVLVADARVQGDGAGVEVRHAIRALERTDVDVIVVTRGGGSAEDLWTFNEEGVVRAIFECRVPVVSAVGHEIDTTLADLVADVRAPTPSAAAELLAPVLAELELQLASDRARLVRSAEKVLSARRSELKVLRGDLGDPRRVLAQHRLGLNAQADRLTNKLRGDVRGRTQVLKALAARLQSARPQAQLRERGLAFAALQARLEGVARRQLVDLRQRLARLTVALERTSPRPRLGLARQALQDQARRLPTALRRRLAAERDLLSKHASTMDAMSPLKVLGRGYAIAQRADGLVVRRAADVAPGDQLRLKLGADDELLAQVTMVKPAAK
jgi:exodeoxyribonuclease VII large subunit